MTELGGISVFAEDPGGGIFRTHSCYVRGLEMISGVHHLLDLTPKAAIAHDVLAASAGRVRQVVVDH